MLQNPPGEGRKKLRGLEESRKTPVSGGGGKGRAQSSVCMLGSAPRILAAGCQTPC